MQQPEVFSRALNTLNYKKDVTDTGGSRDKNPSAILGKAQDSLFSSKTGLRRLFNGGGSSKEIVIPAAIPDEPETLEVSEPTRQFSSTEDIAARLAKIRRGSMTTYTVNLGGAAGGQVEREVRRLAGLAPAFTRSSGTPTSEPAATPIAACFDTVEEMGASATGAGDESDTDAAPYMAQSSSRGGAGGSASRGPARAAFGSVSSGSGDPCRISLAGEAATRHSIELADVTSMPSCSSVGPDGRTPQSGLRPARPPSLPQAFLSAGGAAAAASAAAAAAGSSSVGGVSTTVLPVSPMSASSSSQLVGQLGLMRDRKAQTTTDGYSAASSPGGSNSAAGASAGGGAATMSPTSVLKLPMLSSTPGRALSGPQIAPTPAPGPVLSPFTSGSADSRPGSSRLLLARGATTGLTPAGNSVLTLPDRRSSVENIELGAAVSSGPGGGAASGGRWFSPDPDDLEAVLGGNDELLDRLMAELGGSNAGGGTGPSPPYRASTGYEGSGPLPEPGLLLPRLAADGSSGGPGDRATAQLQELWRVQASLGDQLARDRQALAAGKARRGSLLEDVAGQHQPRWQVTYNVDAPVTHAKLGVVDASRRSELDRMHLTKLVKEQKAGAPAPPSVGAAAVSPVVARARRLSTVMVA